MQTKILTFPNKKKVFEIKDLILKNWKTKTKKKHVLVRNSKVFDWLYLLKKNDIHFFLQKMKKKNVMDF